MILYLHKIVACELVRAFRAIGRFGREQALRGHFTRTPRMMIHLIFLSVVTANGQGVRVIEDSAITYTKFLSKANFDKRFPGEVVTDLSKLNTGWYVIYEHESLSYYFGPILLESIGEDYLAQLKETVEDAVAQRPTIEGYRLELSYEPSVSSPSSSSSISEPPSEPSIPNSMPPQPQQKPSFWSFVKKIFGLG